jgi:hypothetical protein
MKSDTYQTFFMIRKGISQHGREFQGSCAAAFHAMVTAFHIMKIWTAAQTSSVSERAAGILRNVAYRLVMLFV